MISFAELGLKPTKALNETVNEPQPRPDPNIGVIRFLCSNQVSKEITGNGVGGDDRIIWDRRFLDSIKEARSKFYKLLDQGFKAFMVKSGKRSRRQIFEFDPDIEEVVMVAPVIGG